MSNLIKYEAACRALAACKAVDEVKNLLDKAEAMRLYGRMAKDKTLEMDAAEIRMRAERRLGQMLTEQKASVGLSTGSRMAGKLPDGSAVVANDHRPTLADAGISKDLSSRAQKMAAVPEAEFEAEVGEWRDRVQVEGERVSTRLQKAGARAQQEAAPDDSADYLPNATEEAYLIEQEAKLQAELVCLLDADEPLALATAKWKQAQALADTLQLRLHGLMNEKAELIRTVKYWRGQAQKVAA
jgi:hypothetical protein